jgi:hypothetical protein
LSSASAALGNRTDFAHSMFFRRGMRLRSSLNDERHRLDKLAFQGRLSIGELPLVDA